jgi:hypothetical protein
VDKILDWIKGLVNIMRLGVMPWVGLIEIASLFPDALHH